MTSNLPPGVSEGMIPGNRPEDAWAELFWEAIEIPGGLMSLSPEDVARWVNRNLQDLEAAQAAGFREGQEEARISECLNRSPS